MYWVWKPLQKKDIRFWGFVLAGSSVEGETVAGREEEFVAVKMWRYCFVSQETLITQVNLDRL